MSSGPRQELLPPASLEAEEATLGGLLVDPEALYRVRGWLSASDFSNAKHQWLFEALEGLEDEGTPADFLTVCDRLERDGRLDAVGGPAWVTSLLNQVPTSLHVEHYGALVASYAVRRKLLSVAAKAARLAHDVETDAYQSVDAVERLLFEVTAGKDRGELRPVGEQALPFLDAVTSGEGTGRLETGFVDLDKLLGGLTPSDVVVLAARPSVGKTSLALALAENVAAGGGCVAFFSLEVPAVQVWQRLLVKESGVSSDRLHSGELTEEEVGKLTEATGRLAGLSLLVDDAAVLSTLELRSRARRAKQRHGVDLVVVDYLQLLQTEVRGENRTREVSEVSLALKSLARELEVPVLAVSQLSRSPEARADKRPLLSDLRESGALEQDADVVAFVYRGGLYDPDEDDRLAEVLVAKNRNGPTGVVTLYFRKELAWFYDVELRDTSGDAF